MVGNRDMCPAVKLTNALVKRQARIDDGRYHLVWSHARNTDVSSTAMTMLRLVGRTYSFVDFGRAES